MKDTTKRVLLNAGKPSEQEVSFCERVGAHIVGQQSAKEMVAIAYRRFLNPLRDKHRPIFVAYLLGEPGQGKTLTAEEFAEALHGDRRAMIKLNAGNYKEKHRISQLLGAPPSYIGYKDPSDTKEQLKPGQLDTSAKLSMHNKVASRKGSKTPVTIVLIDEAEKMVEELEDMLLSIFDKGEVDFGNNTVGDYSDCIFLLAGNVGSDEIRKLGQRIGFRRQQDTNQKEIDSTVKAALERKYKPEFLDRLDMVVIYETLTPSQKRQIVNVEITRLEERIMAQLPRGLQFELKVDDKAREFILCESLKNKGSARRIKRVIHRLLEEPLGNELIKHTISLGDVVEVTYEPGGEALSFYLCSGEADVAEADRLAVKGSAAQEAVDGLTFQRKVERAARKAKLGARKEYTVAVEAETMSELAELTGALVNDLRHVFGIKINRSATTWEQPFTTVFLVSAIEDQMNCLKERYPEVAVSTYA